MLAMILSSAEARHGSIIFIYFCFWFRHTIASLHLFPKCNRIHLLPKSIHESCHVRITLLPHSKPPRYYYITPNNRLRTLAPSPPHYFLRKLMIASCSRTKPYLVFSHFPSFSFSFLLKVCLTLLSSVFPLLILIAITWYYVRDHAIFMILLASPNYKHSMSIENVKNESHHLP
jgi:hypothetical protein